MPRTYVPFDMFAMQIDVPVSTMVRDGDFGWTCGQCPLGHDGEVLFPGDLAAQANHVCDMIESVMHRGGFESRSIGKLNVYTVEGAPGDGQELLDSLEQRFSHHPVIVPIALPHFYYDGMMIEIDVFAGPRAMAREISTGQGVDLEIVDGGEMIWAMVGMNRTDGAPLAGCLSTLAGALEEQGLSAANLLSDHWFLSAEDHCADDVRSAVSTCALITNPDALVRIGRPADRLMGELTFHREATTSFCGPEEDGKLVLRGRRSGAWIWISGVHGDARLGLVDQTRTIMAGIDRLLASKGASFENVVKLTAHYAGGASPDELHGNMIVRHAYYARPGPASTGLPVTALGSPDCRIAIDVVARA